jgi:hypothetical protein
VGGYFAAFRLEKISTMQINGAAIGIGPDGSPVPDAPLCREEGER